MRLRMMTYNIHRAIGVDRRFRPERIVEIVSHYAPDVVLLQEVDEGVPRSRELDLGRDLAEALGYPHFVVGHNVSLRKGRYGNATLSRYPILRERNIDLTIDSNKRRGCQHTTIVVEKAHGHPHKLDVFNLHLGLGAQERARQIGLLVRSNEFSDLDPEQPSIVGGDFNDWRSLLHPIFTEILRFESVTHRGRATPERCAPIHLSLQEAASTAFTTGDRCALSPRTLVDCDCRRLRAIIFRLSPISICTERLTRSLGRTLSCRIAREEIA